MTTHPDDAAAANPLDGPPTALAGDTARPSSGQLWRAFVGQWNPDDPDNPDWKHLDERWLPWDRARDLIAQRLAGFAGDDCSYCRHDAGEAARQLEHLPADQPFEAEVEGEQYVIAADVLAPGQG